MMPSSAPMLPSLDTNQGGRSASRPGRVILAIGGLLIATAVLGSCYFITSLYQSEVTSIRNRLEIPAHAVAHSVEVIARNADVVLRGIQAELPKAENRGLAMESLRQTLVYRDNASVAINRIAIYDAQGRPILSSIEDPAGKGSVAAYAFFSRQVAAQDDRLFLSDLVPDPVTGNPEIVLSRRIVNGDGSFSGIAAVFVDATDLQQMLDALQMPDGSSVTIFNTNGHMLVRTPAAHFGDRELATDFSKRAAFQSFRDGPADGRFAKFKTVIGVTRFIAGVGSDRSPFVVAAGWDADAALALWRRHSLVIAGATLAALAIALGLLAYLGTQIRRNDKLLAKVSEAEQRQRNLMTALPDAVAIINDKLEIEFANPVAERIHGYGPGELSGVSLTKLMAWDTKQEDEESARGIIGGMDPAAGLRVLQRRARRRDGSQLPIEITTCRYRASDGWKLISVIRDVSVRQANDLALRRSRESLARAQHMAALGSFDRDLRTGAFECSDEFLRMWGFAAAESPPSLEMLLDRVHPQDRDDFVAGRQDVLAGKPLRKSEFRIVRPDGAERLLYNEYNADFDADGKPTRLFGIVQDITERKASEEALRRSRENMARAQSVAALGSFDRDLVTERRQYSEEFFKIWGVEGPARENLFEYLISLVHPDDRDKFLAGREAALKNEPIPPCDFRITRPDGRVRVLHREYGAAFDDSGRPIRLFGTVQDITERKEIEDELRRSREDLARAQEIAAIGSFSRDIATGKTEWSEQFLRIWGLNEKIQQPTADTLSAMVHPADRAAFLKGRNDALEHGQDGALDFRVTRPDGEERILHREYGVVFDETGKAVRMFGTVQDITERKRIEIELRRSRENMARAQRIAGVGSFERDLATGKWEWSDELYRIHGVDRDDPKIGVGYLRNLVHPEDRRKFDQIRELSLQGVTAPPQDLRIIRPDGVERILHRECEIVFDAEGKPARLVATMQDITERRYVELELRRSRENMARAQSLAAIGSFDRDLVTGTSVWSEQLYRIFALDPAAPRPAESELDNLIHPDDRERFNKERLEELSGKAIGPLEYRIIRTDGKERIVRRESQVMVDADNRPVRVFGTLQDITERKRAEMEILQSRESLMRAQRIANMGSFDNDLAAGSIEWSDQMYQILGLERGKVVPSSDATLALVHPEDRDGFMAARLRSGSNNFEAFEFRIIRPDGEERVLRRESDVYFDESGRPIRLFGTLQDVTERRAAEARERELERQLLHSQKLEALGTLAGGIAHDLNNTLVPIMALSKLTARRFDKGTQVRNNLDTIYEASERARDLVRRVLSFSRKDEPEQSEADLAAVVREALKLMRATVPSSIQLEAAIEDVPPVRADGSQIHQVITNLISNAAGAMNNGRGSIAVSLALGARAKGAKDVCLSVADTGCGMDESTLQRIFEPFFTTKAVGQGTGLGLSIVHGIVTSHGGHIEVKSAPGKGTRFDLYFPLPGEDNADESNASSRPAA